MEKEAGGISNIPGVDGPTSVFALGKRNLFIEGVPGTGKSTLLNRLVRQWPECRPYREGDLSPVELAWCSYLTKDEWKSILCRYPDFEKEIRDKTSQEDDRYIVAYTRVLAEERSFYQEMEQYEIYNGRVDFETFRHTIMKRYRRFFGEGCIFECSFFQNSIGSLMLFYQLPEEKILAFYEEAYGILKEKGFGLIYLDSEEIKRNLLHVKRERSDENGNEMWYPLMLNYLKESPYGKAHGYEGIEDVVRHFERRRRLELKIIREVVKEDCLVLHAKDKEEDLIAKCRSFAG